VDPDGSVESFLRLPQRIRRQGYRDFMGTRQEGAPNLIFYLFRFHETSVMTLVKMLKRDHETAPESSRC